MKKKKKMNIFQTCLKKFFSEALNFADFKYVFRFFIPFYDQKNKSYYSHPKYAKIAKNGLKQAKWTHFGGL